MTWCGRCGRYDVWGKGCSCILVGRAWLADEAEDYAKEVWSIYGDDPDLALERWVASRNANNDYATFSQFEPRCVALRPAGGGPVQYYVVEAEMVMQYTINRRDKDHDDVATARESRVRDYLEERRRRAAKRSRADDLAQSK